MLSLSHFLDSSEVVEFDVTATLLDVDESSSVKMHRVLDMT